MIEPKIVISFLLRIIEFGCLIFLIEWINTSFEVKKINSFNIFRKTLNNFLLTINKFVKLTVKDKRLELGWIEAFNTYFVILGSFILFYYSTQFEKNLSMNQLILLLSITSFGVLTALRSIKLNLDNDVKVFAKTVLIIMNITLMFVTSMFNIAEPIINNILCFVTLIVSFKILFLWVNNELRGAKTRQEKIIYNLYIVSTLLALTKFYIMETSFTYLKNVRYEIYFISVIGYIVMKTSIVQKSVLKSQLIISNVNNRYTRLVLCISVVRIVIWKY